MDILIGIGVSILGLLLVFSGYAFARILLTVWGLFFGVMLAGSLVDDLTSSGFLNATLGIVLAVVLGLVFAALAYFFFYAAIVVSGAALGFFLGSGFLQLFGMQPNFLTAMLGIAAGVIFGIAFIVLNLPRAYLIVVTSFAGAVIAIGGLLLVFGRVEPEYFSYVTAKVAIANSLFWTIGTFALAAFGIAAQSVMTSNADIEGWQTTTKPVTTTSDEV